MDKIKQWVALTVLGVLVILAAGWFLLVSPKRSEASDLNAQAAAKQQANAQLVTQLAMLKAQAKDLPAQQAALARVSAKIPDNPAMPSLIRALSKAAADAGVELVSISPAKAVPVAAPVATAVTPAASGSTAAGSSATAAGAVTPSAARAAAASAAAAGVLNSISMSVNVVGGYFQVEQFLDGLESLTRAFKVTALSMTPGDNPVKPLATGAAAAAATGKSLSASVTGLVYTATGRVTTAAAPTTAK